MKSKLKEIKVKSKRDKPKSITKEWSQLTKKYAITFIYYTCMYVCMRNVLGTFSRWCRCPRLFIIVDCDGYANQPWLNGRREEHLWIHVAYWIQIQTFTLQMHLCCDFRMENYLVYLHNISIPLIKLHRCCLFIFIFKFGSLFALHNRTHKP